MNIEFVLFKNLLDDNEDIQIGIMVEDNQVLCLCCYGTFEEEDYEIIEKETIEFSGNGDFLTYLHSKEYENLFKPQPADHHRTIHGDILTPVEDAGKEMVIVCHQVNCKGVMGAGLAKQVKSKFPGVYDLYKEKCKAFKTENLGTVQLCSCLEEAGYIIANVFSQSGYGRTGLYTDYKALRKSFSSLREFDNTVIRIPYKMGCGLGGGDWKTVKQIIYEELIDYGCKVEIWRMKK